MKNFLLFFLFVAVISFSAKSQSKLLWYTFSSDYISGNTVLDESGNGNNALMINGAIADSKGVLKLNDSAYLAVPPVINGLNDFTIYMKLSVSTSHFNTTGGHAQNTFFSSSNSSCTNCFGLAYSKPHNEYELTFNGIVHKFSQFEYGLQGEPVEVVRSAGIVSLYKNGFLVGSFADNTPVDASTFLFGQEEECIGGCFLNHRAMEGGFNEIRVYDGAITLKEGDDNLPAFSSSVSPNPFSSSTTISFSSQQDSHTTIALYDLAGRKLKTLLDENVTAGNHEVQLNRDQLGAGVYFLSATINGSTSTSKLIIQ